MDPRTSDSEQRTNDLARDDSALDVRRREPWVADLVLAQLAIGAMPGRGVETAPTSKLENVDRSARLLRLEDGALELGEKCGASEMG